MSHIPKCLSCPMRPECYLFGLRKSLEVLFSISGHDNQQREMQLLAQKLTAIQEDEKFQEPGEPAMLNGGDQSMLGSVEDLRDVMKNRPEDR